MSLIASLDNYDHGGFRKPDPSMVCYYCLIPKNASSWISQLLHQNNWIEGPAEHQEIDELIVVLRDPVNRWIAGIAQYLCSYVLNSHWYDRLTYSEGYCGQYIPGKENFEGSTFTAQDWINQYNEVTERLLFDQVAFDDHTMLQSWYVNHHTRVRNVTWFYLDNNFEKNFLHHYSEYRFDLPTEPDYNRGDNNEEVKLITEFLRQRIKDQPYLENNLKRFYALDYAMIQQANFVYYSEKELNASR